MCQYDWSFTSLATAESLLRPGRSTIVGMKYDMHYRECSAVCYLPLYCLTLSSYCILVLLFKTVGLDMTGTKWYLIEDSLVCLYFRTPIWLLDVSSWHRLTQGPNLKSYSVILVQNYATEEYAEVAFYSSLCRARWDSRGHIPSRVSRGDAIGSATKMILQGLKIPLHPLIRIIIQGLQDFLPKGNCAIFTDGQLEPRQGLKSYIF